MDKVRKRIEALAKGVEIGYECKATVQYPSSYYEVDNSKDLTEEFMSYVAEEGLANVIECREAMTGEDFGYMLKKISRLHVLVRGRFRIRPAPCKAPA